MKSVRNQATKLGLDNCWMENRVVLHMHWNEKGELMYENKPIPRSHVVDLVNDILRQRKGFEPVGWSVIARSLARRNTPENI